MSENTLNVRLRSAIKTDSEWEKLDPVLLKGEAVYSSDKKLYKIGDGTSKWSELSYNLAESLVGLGASVDELNYSKGLKGNIQDQLDEISKTEYSDATTDSSGLMSPVDKKRIDSVVGAYELGNFSGKTGAELQAALDTWLNTCLGIANASAHFYGAQDWMTAWKDETKTIGAGGRWTVTVVAPYTQNTHVQLRISYYSNECISYVHKSGNTWGDVHLAAFKDDLSDRNVLQSSTGTSDYRPLVLGAKYSSDTSKLADTVTDQVYTSTMIYAQSSTGTIFATKFKGALEGNADTATSASTFTVTTTNPATSTEYYPIFASSMSGDSGAKVNNGIVYYSLEGNASTNGYGILRLGNNKATGAATNKYGRLDLFGTSTHYISLYSGAPTATRSIMLPDASGTIALTTSDILGNAATASKWKDARTLSITGAVTGSATIDGSGDITLQTSTNHYHTYLAVRTNEITTKEKDTTANWGAHQNSVHWYATTGQLTDQPSQWGYLVNIGQNAEVHQLWLTQSSGNIAHRGGNASGWNGTWRVLVDSENLSSYALPITGGTMKGRIQAPSLAGLWTGGMTISNATLGITTQNVSGKYHPIIAGKTTDSHIWNLGTINNLVGFYGFLSGRTENSIDWNTYWNVKTGDMTCSGTITAPTFSGTATNLQNFVTTNNTAYDANSLTTNGIVYTSTDLLGQGDGALYQQYYSDKWIHQIFGDYRTGQIALRGKNNGTWQAWRTVLDSANYKTYCTATNLGFTICSRTSASPPAAAGWYRIATSTLHIANCTGIFKITGVVSGYHTTAIVTAGTSYGVGGNVQVLQCSHYANASITKVRIVYHTTYNNNYAYLEVYKPATGAATPISVSLIESTGWTLVAPTTVGSIPSGYVNKEITLTSNAMSAATFVGALSGNASTASKVYSTSTNPTTSSTYAIPFHANVSSENKSLLNNNGIRYTTLEGTTSANGYGILILGNGNATGTVGNKYGRLDIFGTSAYCISLVAGAPTANRTITLPNGTGTIALTSSSITGNAATSDKWKTARTLSLTGAVTGSVSIDGSGDASLATTVNHTHTYIESLGNYTFDSSTLPNSFSYGLSLGFVNSNSGFGSYGTVITARSYTGGGGSLQLYAPYGSSYGGTHIKARFGDYGTSNGNSWTSLKEIAWTEDITSYAAPIKGSNYYVRVRNTGSIENSNSFTFNDLAKEHCAMGMIYSATDNPTGAAGWVHGISLAWTAGSNSNWISQIALGVQAGDGMWYRTTSGTIVGAAWKRVLDSSNYSSYALARSGGTMSGIISSSYTSNTHINGNTGGAIINSTVTGGKYVMLAKLHSTNGRFCIGAYLDRFDLYYTTNTIVNAGTNTFSYRATLLSESGNTHFPGTVYAGVFSGNYAGGTVTGNIIFNNMIDLYWTNMYNVNCSLVSLEGNTMYLGWGGSGTKPSLYVGSTNTSATIVQSYGVVTLSANNGKTIMFDSGDFRPNNANGAYQLGNGSNRWKVIYATNSLNVSSDRRLKNTILDLDNKYLQLCDYLTPKSYYMNDTPDKIRQIGFVAQEVEQAAEKAGLNLNECGFIHKDYVQREDYQGIEYGLSYDAFGVLAIAKIKQQDKMIKDLQSQIEELRSLIKC